jgi:hypothetical protein
MGSNRLFPIFRPARTSWILLISDSFNFLWGVFRLNDGAILSRRDDNRLVFLMFHLNRHGNVNEFRQARLVVGEPDRSTRKDRVVMPGNFSVRKTDLLGPNFTAGDGCHRDEQYIALSVYVIHMLIFVVMSECLGRIRLG